MSAEITALVSSIKHLAVHDGPGLRTTFFFQGCPLHCRWCHNPEALLNRPQVAYREKRCVGCMKCAEECPANAHVLQDGRHIFLRDRCMGCGKCENACLQEALQCYGRRMTLEEALTAALEDENFYAASGGGVTLSGGEALLQWEFCREFLLELGRVGIHRALDTSGAVPSDYLREVLPHCEMVLYDLKHMDAQEHLRWTGVHNRQILENLRMVASSGVDFEVRIPLIPGVNTSNNNLRSSAEFLLALPRVPPVRVLPYHPYAAEKYRSVGLPWQMPQELSQMSPQQVENCAEALRYFGLKVLD